MVIITEDMLDYPQKSIYELVAEARCEAIKEGIKANAIVINKNLVKVPEMFNHYPVMICGLKSYLTSNELPEDYLFSVLHDPRPMTNADRIRAMSDEELARHLHCIGWDCHLCAEHIRLDNEPLLRDQRCDENCFEHCLEWLQQPAEGGCDV